jgi:predicted PurR-regulated permease PerM
MRAAICYTAHDDATGISAPEGPPMKERIEKALRRQAMFWLMALATTLAFLWLFSGILLPFVAGMALAYFLDPVADMLERRGISRLIASLLILFLFVVVFVIVLMVLVPVLSNQVAGFLERLPDLATRLQGLIASLDNGWLGKTIGIEARTLQENLAGLMKQGAGWIGTLVSGLWSSGKALVGVFSLLIVTPVVAFYMLYDWDRMVAKVDSWLPLDHRDTIRAIFRDIDRAVAGFVRGQGTLCLILGFYYALSLTLLGVNFGLLIGLLAGLISFIPYVGSLTGIVVALAVALVQFWPDWVPLATIVAIFAAGQFLEGNFLQPKLVGDRVGLHPVWLMFALLAFGTLFGFTGLLVAVPAAAAVGVVVRFALARYLQSDLYRGHPRVLPDPARRSARRRGD